MTTTQEQLAALEEIAGVIDPKDDLILCQTGQWYDSPSGNFIYIPSALAIRTQQAIRWLTAWCGQQTGYAELVMIYGPEPGEWSARIVIDGKQVAVGNAPSLPEALAACISAIRNDLEQENPTESPEREGA